MGSTAAAEPLSATDGVTPKHIRDILTKARTSWLKNTEVVDFLTNYKAYSFKLSKEPSVKPTGGQLYMFNRKTVRFFRKDGHSWRKKADGKTVRETHEKLKVENKDMLNCYYAHAEDVESLQRRCYWLLEGDDHIVLVHYLCNSSLKLRNAGSLPGQLTIQLAPALPSSHGGNPATDPATSPYGGSDITSGLAGLARTGSWSGEPSRGQVQMRSPFQTCFTVTTGETGLAQAASHAGPTLLHLPHHHMQLSFRTGDEASRIQVPSMPVQLALPGGGLDINRAASEPVCSHHLRVAANGTAHRDEMGHAGGPKTGLASLSRVQSEQPRPKDAGSPPRPPLQHSRSSSLILSGSALVVETGRPESHRPGGGAAAQLPQHSSGGLDALLSVVGADGSEARDVRDSLIPADRVVSQLVITLDRRPSVQPPGDAAPPPPDRCRDPAPAAKRPPPTAAPRRGAEPDTADAPASRGQDAGRTGPAGADPLAQAAAGAYDAEFAQGGDEAPGPDSGGPPAHMQQEEPHDEIDRMLGLSGAFHAGGAAAEGAAFPGPCGRPERCSPGASSGSHYLLGQPSGSGSGEDARGSWPGDCMGSPLLLPDWQVPSD